MTYIEHVASTLFSGDKMAAMDLTQCHIQTTRALEYTNSIAKIPESNRILQDEHYLLPCVNDYAMMGLYDNPFIIIGTIYDKKKLRKSVMTHLKRNRKYYASIGATYLNLKKLDYTDWLSRLITKKLPVDELCLHAIATFLNIHITVDHKGGFWSTLNLPRINHNLAIALSDIHLVYRGCCKYNLLCKKNLLRSVGRKILLHKIAHDLPRAAIVLNRMELHNKSASLSHINDSTKMDNLGNDSMDTDNTETYDYPDTDSTLLYEIEEKEVGTIYFETDNPMTTGKPKLSQQLYFSCPYNRCNFKSNRRKQMHKHYRRTHKIISKCSYCKKTYNTPYSLTQHLYVHTRKDSKYSCKRCGRIFPFKSQYLIHKLRHARKYNEECKECSLTFKYKHDMLKHCREHFAKEYQCEDCDYIGTPLKLKAHKEQHNSNITYICILCKVHFKHRMSLWRHKQRCRRSNSPEF